MNGILSARMYVLARNIVSSGSCSLCLYVFIGFPRLVHPPKVKYSLSAYRNKGKANGVQAISHIFSNLPAVFCNAQVTNRQVLKHGFTQLQRTAHIFVPHNFGGNIYLLKIVLLDLPFKDLT